jgi:hypothetical protein
VLLDVEASGNVLYLPLDQLGASGAGRAGNMPPIVTPDRSVGQPMDRNPPQGRTANREGRQ